MVIHKKAPRFWQKSSILAKALLPVAWLYRFGFAMRFLYTRPYKSRSIIICVGNINIGGVGKTPFVISLAEILIRKGQEIVFLSRGYGGSQKDPREVDPEEGHASLWGDEALLLARYAPCIVSKDKVAGIHYCEKHYPGRYIVMDDGLQNPHIHKNISIIVMDGKQGSGNGYVLPAGPLRETLASAGKRAQGLVVIGKDHHNMRARISLPSTLVQIKPHITEKMRNHSLIAFAGIGHPEKFFKTLAKEGCKVIKIYRFPDHYPYQDKHINPLISEAKKHQALLITTEKDLMRIPHRLRKEILALPISLEKYSNPAFFEQIFASISMKPFSQ